MKPPIKIQRDKWMSEAHDRQDQTHSPDDFS